MPGVGESAIAAETGAISAARRLPGARILRVAGLSVMTQGVASAGNLVLSLLLLRVLAIDDFGYYVYVFAFGAFGAAVTGSVTGNVYHFLLPRLQRLHHGYESAFNGFNLIITASVASLVTLACFAFPHPDDGLSLFGIAVFITGLTAMETVKLQATANGQHPINLVVEIGKQASLLAAVGVLTQMGELKIATVLIVHGVTALLACAVLLSRSGGGLSFRRIGWIARRHWVYARHLLPSTLIASVQVSAMPLFVSGHFGLAAVGALRSAELPFSAFNPVRQSVAHFLPRLVHEFDAMNPTQRARRFRLLSLVAFGLVLLASAAIWVAGAALMPLATAKDYPAGIGMIYGAAYAAMMLQVLVNCYLNVIGRSGNVLTQSILGAAVAIVTYFATIGPIGPAAAALAVAASFLSMTLFGYAALARHVIGR